MTKPKVRIKPQHYLYVWSITEYNQGGKTIYVSEGEYMRAESYIPGFSDVIWIGRGRPTVRVSLGQSPPWASTKKHFYNCRLMAARCRRRIRRLATALLLHKVPVLQWSLIVRKSFVCDQKSGRLCMRLQNKTWQCTQPADYLTRKKAKLSKDQ